MGEDVRNRADTVVPDTHAGHRVRLAAHRACIITVSSSGVIRLRINVIIITIIVHTSTHTIARWPLAVEPSGLHRTSAAAQPSGITRAGVPGGCQHFALPFLREVLQEDSAFSCARSNNVPASTGPRASGRRDCITASSVQGLSLSVLEPDGAVGARTHLRCYVQAG